MRFYAEKTSGILSLMFVFAWKMWYRIGQQEVITLAATLTNRERTFAMAARELPSPELLRKMLRYEPETGLLFWLPRCREDFNTDLDYKSWVTRFSEKETFKTCGRNNGYRTGKILEVTFYAHRVIWAIQTGSWPQGDIDHIDQDRFNNKWENLREATRSQNNANKRSRKGSSSRYIGVCWISSRQKWQVKIKKLNKCQYIGEFRCEIEAAKAYDAKAREIHGNFASINFPNTIERA